MMNIPKNDYLLHIRALDELTFKRQLEQNMMFSEGYGCQFLTEFFQDDYSTEKPVLIRRDVTTTEV